MRMHIRTINYGVLLTLGYALLFMHFCLRNWAYAGSAAFSVGQRQVNVV